MDSGIDLISKYRELFIWEHIERLANSLTNKDIDRLNSYFYSLPIKGTRKRKLEDTVNFVDTMNRTRSLSVGLFFDR